MKLRHRYISSHVLSLCTALSLLIQAAEAFAANAVNVAELDGSNGFTISNTTQNGLTVVSGGSDHSGDHISDLLIGGYFPGHPNQAYLLPGRNGPFPAQIRLNELNASDGVKISADATQLFFSHNLTAVGDINGDNIDDFVINDLDQSQVNALIGNTYVIFGRASGFSSDFNVNTLDGSNGFVIPNHGQNELFYRVSNAAGDLNGDGLDDLAIGSPQPANTNSTAGRVHIIYGSQQAFPATFNLDNLNGSNGFVIEGTLSTGRIGQSVSRAGDLNGDGIDDIIIGDGPDPLIIDRENTSTTTAHKQGTTANNSYVVFGNQNGFPAQFSLSGLNGSNGFVMTRADFDNHIGRIADHAGDINGDGLDDAMLCHFSPALPQAANGACYIIFGQDGDFPALLALEDLDGSNGFTIQHNRIFSEFGRLAGSAGDVNGDGIDDILIGAPEDNHDGLIGSGTVYIVYGRRGGFPALLPTTAIADDIGMQIHGPQAGANFGLFVDGAGDVNGDGLNDIIASSNPTRLNGQSEETLGYVIFGNDHIFSDGFEI